MKTFSLIAIAASLSFIAGAGVTYIAKTPWSSDMANQPSIKAQEGPMSPPQGSVSTALITGSGVAGQKPQAESGHEGMTEKSATGHVHGSSSGSHDLGSSGSADHRHNEAAGKRDQGSQNVGSAQTTPAQPLPTDLLGSSGTGPGKTLQSFGNQQNTGDKNVGAHNHGSEKTPPSAAKGSQHDHSTHTHGGAADHKPEVKTKAKTSAAPHQHGPSEGAGHSHAGGGDHAHGAPMTGKQVLNPIKATEASVQTGHKLFSIYCAVCHGTEGRGGAPMATKLAGIPKFTAELLGNVDDAHMFSMVTSGHGPMPGYAEALSAEERWHVANYVNTLQKKLANEQQSSKTGASR